MIMQRSSKFIYIIFTIAPIIAAYFIKTKRKKLKPSTDEEKYYFRNLFVYYKKSCRDHVIKSNPCNIYCPQRHLTLLIDFLGTAEESISICVLTLQLLNIFQELLKAHQRGLRVRIILDRQMIAENSPKIQKLKEAGIVIKTQPQPTSCLHHKFCMVDENDEDKARMFFGSMNFTMQGILCNYEHITLTNNYKIIRRFSEELNILWNEFK